MRITALRAGLIGAMAFFGFFGIRAFLMAKDFHSKGLQLPGYVYTLPFIALAVGGIAGGLLGLYFHKRHSK